jgi:glycosyltransferase involved in cell wall biosynthesis
MTPRGGTELQLEFLQKHIDKSLLDKFQICTSVPGKVPIDPSKINILWQKNSYDQANLVDWFKDKTKHNIYDWYVFNSHWNYEQFRFFYDIPTHKCVVIKNGIPKLKLKETFYKEGDPIKLIFHPTPWRGLNVMLAAMQKVTNPLITCDVYSSTQVYGDDFKKANDAKWQGLYEQAKQLPNVNYIGYKPNEYILENLHKYDAFVYPNIWEETFCISALESLAVGLFTVLTDHGALYETGAEFPTYIPMEKDYVRLAEQTAGAINSLHNQLKQDGCKIHLKFQQKYFNHFYAWDRVAFHWNNFLQGALNARSK